MRVRHGFDRVGGELGMAWVWVLSLGRNNLAGGEGKKER
jgi:hypothetical protein